MRISIDNTNYNYHYEIIESIIKKYDFICNISKSSQDQLYLENIQKNDYILYIQKKYPRIIINQNQPYDKKIYITFYPKLIEEYKQKLQQPSIYYFISHRVDDDLLKYSNVKFLTPLCNQKQRFFDCDILPKITKKKTAIPIYAVQGKIYKNRRDYQLLFSLAQRSWPYDFKIKFIGDGNLDSLPTEFLQYRNKIQIVFKSDYEDYHKHFEDVYVILPLLSKIKQPHYYKDQLTSTMNYIKAYQFKTIIDQDLQNIYQFLNTYVYPGDRKEKEFHEKYIQGFTDAFEKSLIEFYEGDHNASSLVKKNNDTIFSLNQKQEQEQKQKQKQENLIVIIDHQNQNKNLEVIESIIHYYYIILKIPKDQSIKIYLENISDSSFVNYIQQKYTFIQIINTAVQHYHFKIFSFFQDNAQNIQKYQRELKDHRKYYFLLPKYDKKFDIQYNHLESNFFYYISANLTQQLNCIPLSYFPSISTSKFHSAIPIYVIEADIYRKNYNQLFTILKMKLSYNYQIKLISYSSFSIPKELKKYEEKIIIKDNLTFSSYFHEIEKCYAYIPLVNKENEPQYYQNTYLSTLNYAKFYKKKSIIDEKLQSIYQLTNVEVYQKKNDIWRTFQNSLKKFYE